MDQHTVLVFAYYFPPMGLSGVQRVSKFVKYLPEQGWRPIVVTTGPTAYYAHDASMLEDFEGKPIEIHRTSGKDPNSLLKDAGTIKMPREFVRKFLNRLSSTFFVPDNKRSWAKQALITAREIVATTHVDAIFVSGPPFSAMMAASALAQETGIPLVVDYRDLWYGNQFSFYPTPWHAHLHKKLEYDVLTHVAKVIVTNRRIKERLINTYPHLPFDDVVIISQGFDPDDFRRPVPTTARTQAFKLTYAGIFYEFVTPKYMFKAVAQFLRERPNAAIELHFAGLLRDEHAKTAKSLGLDAIVHDHGYCSHADTIDLLRSSDALWMMVGNGKNADTVSSGKLYEYFGTGKPVLASLPQGSLRQAAERYGAAQITDPTDVASIAASIAIMYDQWRANTQPKADAAFVRTFDRRVLTSELAKQLAHSMNLH
ncbi:glycosyltransferase family 4 protein [soil metagenome]